MNNNKMCMLATKVVAKSNGVDGILPDELLKCCSECKGLSLVPDDKAPEMSPVCLTKEDNNFYQSTSASDHLLSCVNLDMNDVL